jgi:polyisoprenoid-binding protein YceI
MGPSPVLLAADPQEAGPKQEDVMAMLMVRRLGLAAMLLPGALAAQAQTTRPPQTQTQEWTQTKTYTKPAAGGVHWVVDPVHSEVTFRIRHLVGRVRGGFTRFNATLVTTTNDWRTGTVNVYIQTKSINTNNETRDADLRSPNFFSVDSFPLITFESTGIVAADSNFEMGGLLTIKGKTKPVVLSGEYRGLAKDSDGKQRVAFEGKTLINRKEFNLKWNESVDGGAILGDDVEIEIALEAIQQ